MAYTGKELKCKITASEDNTVKEIAQPEKDSCL
jgi:hypothetical protein